MILFFELVAVATYAVSGAMTAVKRKMDMFGIIVLGIITATGGGIIRDILLGITPPNSLVHPVYIATASIFSAIILVPYVRRTLLNNELLYDKIMFFLDTAGLGLFTVLGVGIAFNTNACNMCVVVLVGVITGVGGGVLRDMFSGNIPNIFVKHIYACASIAGALLCAVIWNITGKFFAMLAGFLLVFVIRCLSAYFKWNLFISDNNTDVQDDKA